MLVSEFQHPQNALQKIILTCGPKIASWIHFNFCNFIPQLSQVETDGSGQWHEGKEDQVSKKATLANIIQREPSHLNARRWAFLQDEKLQSVFLWSYTAQMNPAFIAPPERGGLCLRCVFFRLDPMRE